MSLFSILRLIVFTFIVLTLFIAVLIFPPGKEIPLTQFANPNLIGYAKIRMDPQNQVIRSWIQTILNDFWEKQKDTFNFPKPLLKLILSLQHHSINKIVPYYAGAMFYQSGNPLNPIVLYLINSRIHQSLFKFLALPISIWHAEFQKKTMLITEEIEIDHRKPPIYRYGRYWFMFYRNLGLLSDKLVAFQYALNDTIKTFPSNILMIESFFNSKSDIMLILYNRFKTFRSAQKYLEKKKFSLDSELAIEFYETMLQRLKIYSDSIVATGIEADIVDDDKIKGKWLIVMNSEKAARKIALVIDGLHQLASQELTNREILYSVERNVNNNQVISEFEIKGLKKLILPN